ncbi:MAG: PspC domain-containing protein [Sphingomonas bacterium]|nr:PspC domain-containing protein [Sphingomonas bacterium]
MTSPQPSLFARPDTFFGVCQGMGEDLRIHPNLFRVAFGMAFFFVPLATLAIYFLLGLVVAATRYAFPVPSFADPAAAAVKPATALDDHDDLKLAA